MIHHSSLFSQLLTIFSRYEFSKLVRGRGSDYCIKGFSNWTHFVSMLFCQLAQARSLREICNGLKCCLGKLVHLGLSHAPSKVTLLRWNLMSYRNLWLWLDAPFDTPPDNINFEQTVLPLPDLDSNDLSLIFRAGFSFIEIILYQLTEPFFTIFYSQKHYYCYVSHQANSEKWGDASILKKSCEIHFFMVIWH